MLQGKKDKKLYMIMAAATILIGAVFFVYLYLRPVNNYSFDVASAKPDIGRMEEDGYYFDSTHAELLTEDKQDIYLNIPMEVKAGSYTLRVGYRSNAGSTLTVTSKSNPWAVKCDRMSLNHLPEELPGEFNMNYGLGYLPGFNDAQMYITEDVNDLDICVVYCGFKEFTVQSVELIGNRTYIKTIWPAFMALLIIIELLILGIIKGYFKTEKGVSFLIIMGIALLSSIPLLFKMGLLFDDGDFLYGKINGIIDGLRDGQFPVRIHPNTLKGYGYALSYFYPELFLYPFAILRGIGYSLRFCVYLMFFCTNLATAAVSFVCVRRVVNEDGFKHSLFVSAVCSILYTFNSYRLIDIYARGAIAEAMAIVFLPLVVTGLYVILKEDGSISWLTVGLFGLVNTHILSCELVAVFAILLCVVCFKKIFSKNSLVKLVMSCGITFLLSTYFIIPFLHMSTTDSFKVYAENAYETSGSMLSLKDILGINISIVGKINNGTFFDTRYTLGMIIVIYCLFLYIFSVIKKKNNIFTNICFLLGVIALWFSSELFPWKVIENAGGIIRTIFCMVQFPWRYLSIAMACFMFSIAGCLKGYLEVQDEKHSDIERKKLNPVIYVTTISCMLVVVQAFVFFSTLKITASDEQLIFDGTALSKYNMVGMGEYEPVNFDNSDLDYSIEELQYKFNENAIINPTGEMANLGLTIGPLSKSGTSSSILIVNPTGAEQILYMPITYYEGYRVKNVAESEDGKEIVPELFETDFGTVGLKIPAGYYNGAHITYHENTLYRISELISLLTLAGLAVFRIRKNGRKEEN